MKQAIHNNQKHFPKNPNLEVKIPKDKNSKPVIEFISEGNPNTDKVIQKTQESAAQVQEEAYWFSKNNEDE